MKLEKYLEEKNISLYKLSKATSITIQQLKNYQVGRSEATECKIIKICLALDISPNDLLGWDDIVQKFKK